ncbi:programmed cell death 6-interacting protein [Sporothrix schenckii 1099-18]|uniref:Programmed cell death 6-interacting protein n=1 Tax=Sporothrix schenckii 1099-18 TaxID=1397361 RepID=A0A0F2LZA8_SPOSC|nr:programmed cell death 6-interacting protein [Sporothrix schenckii 1099-18]KJR81226.1 programmed cell death 6-interacting protein [Sporothrix schenckii 1099-18]
MASSQTNQLSLPFRKSTHLSLATAIGQYVADKYGQHPDTFREDMDVIDTLRRDAVNVREAHPSGIKKLQAYAGQLAWIGGKFPVEMGAEFTWYPALGYNVDRPVVQNNLKFERANVLYNLAALYSQLAAGTGHGDADSLKTAASYFMQAAGVLGFLRDTVITDPDLSNVVPEDMDAATLDCLEQLMLAQAQESFWLRAVSERYKDATIAKLAARLADLYDAAGEAAMKSDAVSRAWIHHISAKHHHFAAAAQYRASLDCLDKRKYGEEVARLQDSLLCVAEGLKENRGGYLSKTVVEDLTGLKRRVEEDLKRAERDNDVIYLQVVPPKSELKILDRANMATVRIPPQVEKPFEFLGDQAEFGPALFSKLVPFAVHLAVSVYEERRDRLVNQNIIHDLEVLTEQLHGTLLELNLPGSLQAIERPLGLPGSLVQHAEEMRYADAVNRAKRSFEDINKLRAGDRATFDEGKALLAVEADEDAQLRRKYGTERWTRPEGRADGAQGQKLWTNADEIEGYFASSGSSDGVVRDMFASIEDMLILLAGPDRALMDFVPNSRKMEVPEAVKPSLGRLRSAYNDVLRLESRRRKRVDALREKARADDVKPDILKETARLERAYPNTPIVASHFDSFFATRLRELYDDDQDGLVQRERADQEKALDDVARANREFVSQKKASTGSAGGGGHEREAALQKLDNAHYKYKEVVRNVEVGRKFYNDLSKIVGAFRDQSRAWVQQRRSEAQAIEEELSMPVLSSLSLGHQQQQPQQQQQQQQHHQHQHFSPPPQQQPPAIQSWAGGPPQQPTPIPVSHQQPLSQQQPPPPPPQQPQPQQHQMWNAGMGIRFGNSPAPGGTPQPRPGGGAPGGNPAQTNPHGTWDPSSGIRFG